MPDEFYIDPDALERRTGEVRNTGQDLKFAFQRLTAVLDDHHGCWGTDDIGKAFAQNYVPAEKDLVSNGEQAGTGFVQLADDLKNANTTFVGVDQENAQQIGKTSGVN